MIVGTDLLSETMQIRRGWSNSFKVLEEKSCQSRILHLEKKFQNNFFIYKSLKQIIPAHLSYKKLKEVSRKKEPIIKWKSESHQKLKSMGNNNYVGEYKKAFKFFLKISLKDNWLLKQA